MVEMNPGQNYEKAFSKPHRSIYRWQEPCHASAVTKVASKAL